MDSFADRTVFQTREWLEFVAETQQATPVVAEIETGGRVVGYFSGLVFHRFGVKILGSPFPGWTTPYMGFNLEPGVPASAALAAIERFAFRELKCLHLEVCDRHFREEDGLRLGFSTDFYETYETDLLQTEEQLLRNMSENCRWSIRKASKHGVTVEEAQDEGFAEDFYPQLEEVFQKQRLVPTYDLQRVQSLIRHLLPAGRLLLLRARDSNGACIATAISPAMNKTAHFWATASLHSGQSLRPNEALRWHAIRYWKSRGMEVFDWGGGGAWKEKFGPQHAFIPRFHKSRFRLLSTLRREARRLVAARQRLLGEWRTEPTEPYVGASLRGSGARASAVKCRLLQPGEVPWERLEACPDRLVFQTRPWLDFIAETQGAVPVVCELEDSGEAAGYFTGLVIRRFGVRILGSSFPGWTTPYMGFNLKAGCSRREALAAVEKLAFGELKCLHMEIWDRQFQPEDGQSLGFEMDWFDSYETDLRLSEEEILRRMDKTCRWSIRKAEKSGVRVEEAHDDGFAKDYYEQLIEVFGKQKLAPTYGIERVQALLRHLLPTGNLLLLRALGPDNACIATGIYPGMNRVAEFWGNASFRSGLSLCPNQALHWHAMRYWKGRGAEVFDWGGGGGYKEKYGPRPIRVPRFHKSRYGVLTGMRKQAQKLVAVKQQLLGGLYRRFRG